MTIPRAAAPPEPPALLGRGAVVGPGQPSPQRLADSPRIVVDAAAVANAGPVVERLHRMWVARTPYVVELRIDPAALQVEERSTDPVHTHDPRFLFPVERLRYLVWANTVDHRDSTPTWWHTVKAVRAITGLTVGGPADVILPDGRPAWIDGGPRQPLDLPELVVHRDDTERGVLAVASDRGPAVSSTVGLAPDQAAAVTAPRSVVRVAAPAGSGKTRVLTSRLVEVLRTRGVPADSVLALAYNTAAAEELRQRTGVPGARVATVHAHALAMLRRHVGDLEVLGEREVRAILAPLVDPPRRANVDPLQGPIEALERVRIALVDPAVVAEEREDVPDLPALLDRYREQLRRRGAVDFPEMVYRAIELLLTDPVARAAEQARVGEVLVDEFQDLTPAYLLLIRLISSPQLQCFGVGDDDQVIYGHAGARPDYLLHFDRLFPGAEDHPLTVNYRCPAPVVRGAVALLSHNEVRLDKEIRPGPGASTAEIAVSRVAATAQSRTAGAAVASHLEAGRAPDDIAVLARVRVALLGTQAELATRGIPTRSPVGEWLLARTGVRAALTYLRLATETPMAGDDLAEILHRPLRPIPSTAKDRLRGRRWTPESLGALADAVDPGGSRRAMRDLVRDLEVLRRRAERQPTAEVLRYITDVIGLADVAESLDHGEGGASADAATTAPTGSSHLDDLKALQQVADHCREPAAFEHFLTDVVTQPDADGPAVTLSTIHSVKGLEWPAVVVVEAGEGTLPHRLATGAAALEEERRVFHVAITRAREHLTVVAPRTGTSRFVSEVLGEPTLLGRTDAPRPTAGRAGTPVAAAATRAAGARPPGRRGRGGGSTPAGTRYRAVEGLELTAPGGLAGTIEAVTDEGALIRTPRGSLLRLRFGSEVRVDGALGTLAKP